MESLSNKLIYYVLIDLFAGAVVVYTHEVRMEPDGQPFVLTNFPRRWSSKMRACDTILRAFNRLSPLKLTR